MPTCRQWAEAPGLATYSQSKMAATVNTAR